VFLQPECRLWDVSMTWVARTAHRGPFQALQSFRPRAYDIVPGLGSVHLLLVIAVSPVAPQVVVGVDRFLVSVPSCLLLVFVLLIVFRNVHILIGVIPRIFEFRV